jgi:hypothetical protein
MRTEEKSKKTHPQMMQMNTDERKGQKGKGQREEGAEEIIRR